jgi:hypothetical protein
MFVSFVYVFNIRIRLRFLKSNFPGKEQPFLFTGPPLPAVIDKSLINADNLPGERHNAHAFPASARIGISLNSLDVAVFDRGDDSGVPAVIPMVDDENMPGHQQRRIVCRPLLYDPVPFGMIPVIHAGAGAGQRV